MTPEIQTLLTVSVPTLTVLIGILVNNARLSDLNRRIDRLDARVDKLESSIDRRFDDLKEMWCTELRRVEEVIDARLTHLEERIG